MCPICNNYPENTDHCLFDCYRARDLWRLTFDRVFLEEDFHGSFKDRWIKIDANSSLKDLELVATTCQAICGERNKIVHEESISPINIRSRWIKEYLENFRRANERTLRNGMGITQAVPRSLNRNACWSPPPEGFWKLNSDAACSSDWNRIIMQRR